jgi:hypothetical protein
MLCGSSIVDDFLLRLYLLIKLRTDWDVVVLEVSILVDFVLRLLLLLSIFIVIVSGSCVCLSVVREVVLVELLYVLLHVHLVILALLVDGNE